MGVSSINDKAVVSGLGDTILSLASSNNVSDPPIYSSPAAQMMIELKPDETRITIATLDASIWHVLPSLTPVSWNLFSDDVPPGVQSGYTLQNK